MKEDRNRNGVAATASLPAEVQTTTIYAAQTISSTRSAPEVNPAIPSGSGSTSSPLTSTDSTLSGEDVADIFKLPRCQRILAGSGHVLNDLCASLWFTYLLLYFQKVVKFNDAVAAGLLFWGQVVDGIATPLVGYETDHVENLWPCSKTYGRCKSWHLLGILLVLISFPFIFSPCPGYSFYTDEWSDVADWKKAVYYAPFIAIFQTGWACTQISHLALIPKLTPDDMIRTEILAIRYAFTVGSNITVFILTWIFLTGMGGHENCSVDTQDSSSFSYISLISLGIGGLFSILFHACVEEKPDQLVKRSVSMLKVHESMSAGGGSVNANNVPISPASGDDQDNTRRLKRNRTPTDLRKSRGSEGTQALLASDEDDEFEYNIEVRAERKESKNLDVKTTASKASSSSPVRIFSTKTLTTGKEKMYVLDWLKLPQFYTVACIYLSTRMAVNLSQTYMPLYVETSLGLNCGAVAVIPLIMYCSGFAVSLIIKLLNKHLGRQLAYTIGALFVVAAAGMIIFLDWNVPSHAWGIYLVAVLLGSGLAAVLVTSLSITADLIGNNIESGAFVYGAMSFCDKISCGLAVVLISNLNPCKDEKQQHQCTGSKQFYTDALGFSSGGAAISGMIFIILMTFLIMRKHKREQATSNDVPT